MKLCQLELIILGSFVSRALQIFLRTPKSKADARPIGSSDCSRFSVDMEETSCKIASSNGKKSMQVHTFKVLMFLGCLFFIEVRKRMGFRQGFGPNAWVALPNHCAALQAGLKGYGMAMALPQQ